MPHKPNRLSSVRFWNFLVKNLIHQFTLFKHQGEGGGQGYVNLISFLNYISSGQWMNVWMNVWMNGCFLLKLFFEVLITHPPLFSPDKGTITWCFPPPLRSTNIFNNMISWSWVSFSLSSPIYQWRCDITPPFVSGLDKTLNLRGGSTYY
jgi:hypothetical protein